MKGYWKNFTHLLTVLAFTIWALQMPAQTRPPKAWQGNANLQVTIKNGRLIYTHEEAEVALFGVNYTAPFAHAYRALAQRGINHEEAIRQDVYHMQRMGLTAFRVHVWDVEISDTLGNLLQNEHLRLFDFLLAETAKRGIKTIITPIAFWGNGYPEPDEATPGFATKYGKYGCTTNDTAIKAQENYLRQFFNHRNPYTGYTYLTDPSIIATEINNEPSHGGNPASVTAYINRLVAAIRSTGWQKPIFYNISQNPAYAGAVAASEANGFSFQWYPTGLVGGRSLPGNMLPHVSQYRIPFADNLPAFKGKPLMVYEFDAADVMQPYMYPAMARSFKAAGFQWATQFAYDAMGIAHANTEYQTHYLNLAYTPAKAISMLIAAQVFKLPATMLQNTDTVFGPCTLHTSRQLSIWNTDTAFYYTGSNDISAANPNMLKHFAGTGSSPMVRYTGTGAYFLDKLADGLWRLEVMPDAIAVNEPFAKASAQKAVSVIRWQEHAMQINLPNLGPVFSIAAIGQPAVTKTADDRRTVTVKPGVYLLTRQGYGIKGNSRLPIMITEEMAMFAAPPATAEGEVYLYHQPPTALLSNKEGSLQATMVAPPGTQLWLLPAMGQRIQMLPVGNKPYTYNAPLPPGSLQPGYYQYRLAAYPPQDTPIVFPGNHRGQPYAWDFLADERYEIPVYDVTSSLPLWQLHPLASFITYPGWGRRGAPLRVVPQANGNYLVWKGQGLQPNQPATLQWEAQPWFAFAASKEPGIPNSISATLQANQDLSLKLVLLLQNGTALAMQQTIKAGNRQPLIWPLDKFKPDSMVVLPRPYPEFQSFWFSKRISSNPWLWQEVQHLQWQVTPATDTPLAQDWEIIFHHLEFTPS